LDDLIVGVYLANPNGMSSGKSYVVFGTIKSSKPSPLTSPALETEMINLSAIADTSNPLGGFVINSEAVGDYSGFSVSSAGDVNGDGLDDLIVGAYTADPSSGANAGKSTIKSSKPSPLTSPALETECPLRSPAASPLITKPPVGAYTADPSSGANAGKSYVVFGKSDSSAINLSVIADANNPLGGFVINGEMASNFSGFSVSNAGDVNGDGLDDLIVGWHLD
jgi:hypothetical protein